MGKDDIEKALRDIYEQGLNDAWEAARDIGCIVAGLGSPAKAKIFGTCSIDTILRENTAAEAVEKITNYKKRNFYQVGDVISDGNRNLLIVNITDKAYECLSGRDFEPVSIGKDYICEYQNLNDRKDMHKLIERLADESGC